MNADALLHHIRLKVPAGHDARDTLRALRDKLGFVRPTVRLEMQQAAASSEAVTFRTMVSSAVVEAPRRLNWHPLAILDFALTGGIILVGGVGTWLLIDMMFGFLAW